MVAHSQCFRSEAGSAGRDRELGQLLQGIQLVGEVSSRSADLLVSFGERLAVPLVAAAINVPGGRAALMSPASAADAVEMSGMASDVMQLVERQPEEIATLLRSWLADQRERV